MGTYICQNEQIGAQVDMLVDNQQFSLKCQLIVIQSIEHTAVWCPPTLWWQYAGSWKLRSPQDAVY